MKDCKGKEERRIRSEKSFPPAVREREKERSLSFSIILHYDIRRKGAFCRPSKEGKERSVRPAE